MQFHDARVHHLSTQERTCHSHGPRGFLLPDGSDSACEARAFLHKPSEDRMRETGAVHVTQHPGGENEWAHTDSAFFFDCSVAVKLVEFWDDVLDGIPAVKSIAMVIFYSRLAFRPTMTSYPACQTWSWAPAAASLISFKLGSNSGNCS